MQITLHIVSACCSKYFDNWIRFFQSAREKAPAAILHFYDLGLSDAQKEYLKTLDAVFCYTFDFSKYPEWVHISKESGQWAWKAQCIQDVMLNRVKSEDHNVLLWCDSANLLLDDLTNLVITVVENGIYSPVSSGSIQRWTHPYTIDYFNAHRFLEYPMRNAALPAFFLDCEWVRDFIHNYARLSLIKDCIYPEGSHRGNHRQDQSVLSLLYYIYQERYPFRVIDGYIGISIHNFNANFVKPYDG